MTRPDEQEADRLWIEASQLRLIADGMEARAATFRPSRTPLDHRRYFRLLAARDCLTLKWGASCEHEANEVGEYCALCDYCLDLLHPFDPTHERLEFENPLGGERLQYCSTGGHRLFSTCAHIEHRTPVARGGTNELNNLCLACTRCNRSKGTMTEREYRTVRVLALLCSPGVDEPLDLTNLGFAVSSMVDVVSTVTPEAAPEARAWGERLIDAFRAHGFTHRPELEPF